MMPELKRFQNREKSRTGKLAEATTARGGDGDDAVYLVGPLENAQDVGIAAC
ncbi:hypothetical protein [Geotalea sp. SG265]|uniref:hypothetical protein n=1 Tax=Geotalea sp. SG265 TaxID=2922867 RepID=UPI001FAE9758|nr:hypothetical protein [Geotalea sp. SG265]